MRLLQDSYRLQPPPGISNAASAQAVATAQRDGASAAAALAEQITTATGALADTLTALEETVAGIDDRVRTIEGS